MVYGSTGLDQFFNSVHDGLGLYSVLPDGVSITFDLTGPGGGVWTVSRDGDDAVVLRRPADRPDCRLSCSVQDFKMLLNGELSSKRGFLEGRLEVEGDVGLVLRLQRILVSRKD